MEFGGGGSPNGIPFSVPPPNPPTPWWQVNFYVLSLVNISSIGIYPVSQELSSRGSVGFTTVIRHGLSVESPLFSIAGTEPIKLGCLSRLVTGRYPIFGFFTNTGHPRIQWLLIISHHYPHLDCYILNCGGIYIIYIYMWICIAPCLDKHAIYDFIIYIYRYAYRYRYKCIWNVYIHTSRYIQ